MTALLVQFARFATVGLGATALHLITAWLFHHFGKAAPLTANAIGFAAAFSLSYLGHFHWTFGRTRGHSTHLPRFLVVSGVGFACTHLITWAATEKANLSFDLSLVLILLTVPLITWTLARLWAFRA